MGQLGDGWLTLPGNIDLRWGEPFCCRFVVLKVNQTKAAQTHTHEAVQTSKLIMRTVILWWGVILLLASPEVFCLRRHERHRRDPSARADPEVLGLSDSELREEQKENKFKPEFERCDDYKPEVEEESQTGKKDDTFFSIITPFFSRKDTIMREEHSVEK